MLNFSKINILIIYLIFFIVAIFSVLNLQQEDNQIIEKKAKNINIKYIITTFILEKFNTKKNYFFISSFLS